MGQSNTHEAIRQGISKYSNSVPYKLTRLGLFMSPEPGNYLESDGVLNPGSGRDIDGELYLLPRIVAAGNVSRVGIAKILIEDGIPVGVQREGVALAPDAGWERSRHTAGTEDPRITWIPSLGLHVMSYSAYGPLGSRPAIAVSKDLHTWSRLGPIHFVYQPDLDFDLNLATNKDVVFFPEIVSGPNGIPCYMMIHRPNFDFGWLRQGEGVHLPAGITDPRPSIWVSYTPAAEVQHDINKLVYQYDSKLLAASESPFESVHIGAGPPPIRVPEGWLFIYHGVSKSNAHPRPRRMALHLPWSSKSKEGSNIYSAGAMILDIDDPSIIIARTSEPLMSPETIEEISGTINNVVFPTAIEEINSQLFVFYGMADSNIGVARLDRKV